MAHEELISYIKVKFDEGHTRADIQEALLKAGWAERDVGEAFVSVQNRESADVPIPSQKVIAFDTIGETFNKTIDALRNRGWVLLAIVALPALAVMILSALIVSVATMLNVRTYSPTSLFEGRGLMSAVAQVDTMMFPIIGIVVVLALGIIILNMWSQVALVYAIHNKTGVRESYRKSFSKILSYWWITILSGLIVMAGFFLLIVPGIIFSVWFVFASYIFIVEGKKGVDALNKSREYVRGYAWNIFVKLFVMMLALLSCFLVVGIVASTLSITLGYVADFPKGGFSTIQKVLDSAAQLVTTVFGAIFVYQTYMNVREIKTLPAEIPTQKGLYAGLAVLGVVGIVVLMGVMIVGLVMFNQI